MIAVELNGHQDHPIRAKNVILLIGDGMGQAHRFAGQLASVGLVGRLRMDQFPFAGLMGTTSDDPQSIVTDSAAAATAMACGIKTYNRAIGVRPDLTPVPSVLDVAKWAGKRTGLITTCHVTDATPAAFAAHVDLRVNHREIARQYIEDTAVDVILGGGREHWHAVYRGDENGTNGSLLERAATLGYAIASTPSELEMARSHEPGKLLGLFAEKELFSQESEGHGDRYDPPVSLAEMTQAAIEILDRGPNGFFLMVEEAAIDRMAHRNNAPLTIRGVQALDDAVGVAIRYAERHPDTLVIVAADHETGGLALAGPDDPAYPYELPPDVDEAEFAGEDGPFRIAGSSRRFIMGWTTTGHTAAAVPVSAMGPGAERVHGLFENTDLFTVMVEAMATPVPARSR